MAVSKKKPHKPGQRIKLRTGQLSDSEKLSIQQWLNEEMAIDAIALKLNRSERVIKNYAFELSGEITQSKMTVAEELTSSKEWVNLQAKFLPDELQRAKDMYIELVDQLGRDDVLATERHMLFEVLEISIFKDRLSYGLKLAESEMRESQLRIDDLKERYTNKPNDKTFLFELDLEEVRYGGAKASLKDALATWEKFSNIYSKKLESLKATRKDRITKIAGSTGTFLSLVKMLYEQEWRDQNGDELGYIVVAQEVEKKKLSQNHTFADGLIDQPLLTSETCNLGVERSNELPQQEETEGS